MFARTNQYVSFRIGTEIYALDVGNAREIVPLSNLTRIPKALDWILGVVNLRDVLVPIIDLRRKFDMGVTEMSPNSSVVLVEFALSGEPVDIGILVDNVLDVFELPTDSVEPTPKFGTRSSRKYLRGMCRRNGQVILILDAEQAFADAEPELLNAANTTQDMSFEATEPQQSDSDAGTAGQSGALVGAQCSEPLME